MKKMTRFAGSCLWSMGVLVLSVGSALAVSVPYVDTFSAPPYTNNATIIGANGWQKFRGADSSMTIINDPTGSGRGTVLNLTNAPGTYPDDGYWPYQTIDQSYATGDLRIQFDIYGTKPDPDAVVFPNVIIRDSQGFTSEAAAIEGRGNGDFRLNNNSLLIVPGITAQGGKWYTITFDFAFNPKRYNVEVTDGVSTGRLDNVPFWTPTANGVGWITFRPQNFGDTFEGGLVDNLIVVPEPSTLLLALASLAAFLGRRRLV